MCGGSGSEAEGDPGARLGIAIKLARVTFYLDPGIVRESYLSNSAGSVISSLFKSDFVQPDDDNDNDAAGLFHPAKS